MRKTLVTAFTIGSLAFSTLQVKAAQAADTTGITTSLIQSHLSRTDRAAARLSEFATLLAVPVEQVQSALKNGKKPLQIVAEQGITKDQLKQRLDILREHQLQEVRAQLSAQVASGSLSQAQMDARLKTIAANNNKSQGWHRRQFGF